VVELFLALMPRTISQLDQSINRQRPAECRVLVFMVWWIDRPEKVLRHWPRAREGGDIASEDCFTVSLPRQSHTASIELPIGHIETIAVHEILLDNHVDLRPHTLARAAATLAAWHG
jgi:hypothetical protein